MKKILVISVVCILSSFGEFVHAQTSTIDDLTLCKSTFFGLNRNIGYLLDVAVDAQGFVYGTGWCTSMQATSGAYRSVSAGRNDIMVFKMDPTLSQVIWATYIGGSNDEAGGSIAVNAQGEVYVSGYTLSANFPTVNNVGASYLQDEYVCNYVLKLSSDGSQLLYSSILGRGQPVQKGLENASKGAVLSINPQGEAFVFSQIPENVSYTISLNAYQRVGAGKTDLVLSKMSATGGVLYSTYYGGMFDESAYDICYANGTVYMCGSTSSDNIPLRSGKNVDVSDCFVLSATDGGNFMSPQKCFVFGSGSVDVATALCFDAVQNRICVSGTVLGTNMPYTSVLQAGQVTGGFVCAFDVSLQYFRFCTMLGYRVVPRSLVTNSNAKVFVGSYVGAGGTAPVTPNALQYTPQGNFDGSLICLDSSGSSLRYGTYLGGRTEDYSAVNVLLSRQGCFLRVIVGLTTHSTNFPSSADAYQEQKLNGDEDQPALCLFTTTEDLLLFKELKICQRELSASLSGTCQAIRFQWDFGDGSYDSSGASVKHVYAKSGSYTLRVRLLYSEPDTIVVSRLITVISQGYVDAGADRIVCTNSPPTQLQASGAEKYTWTPTAEFDNSAIPNPKVQPKVSTTYYCRGVDVNGCVSFDSVSVYVNSAKAVVSADTTICEGQSVLLHASGGLQVAWDSVASLKIITSADVIASPKSTTKYRVIVTNTFCTDTGYVLVRVQPLVKLRMPTVGAICPSNELLLKPSISLPANSDSSAYRYQWTPLQNISDPTSLHTTVNPSETTTYYLTVTSAEGCSVTDSVKITMRVANTVSVISDTAICLGASFRLWSQGATRYAWSPKEGLDDTTLASPTCTPSQTTRYRLVSLNGPCLDTHYVSVSVALKPTVRALGDTTVCAGTRVRLSVENPIAGVSYTWQPSKDFESPVGAEVFLRSDSTKTYIVTARSNSSCSTDDSVHVRIENSLDLSVADSLTPCAGQQCVVELLSPYDSSALYTMEPPLATFNASTHDFRFVAQQSVDVVIRIQRSTCTAVDTAHIQIRPSATLTSVTADTTVCKGSQLQLRAVCQEIDVQYRWLRNDVLDNEVDNATSSSPVTRILDSSTSFSVEITRNGCSVKRNISVKVVSAPSITIAKEPRLCIGDSVLFVAQCDQPVRVLWTPLEGLSSDTSLSRVMKPLRTTDYELVVTNSQGCSSSWPIRCVVSKPQDLNFSIPNVRVRAGEDADIIINAQSNVAMVSDIDLSITCAAGLFLPTSVSTDSLSQGLRYMHLHLPSASIGSEISEIGRIRGTALLSLEHKSPVTIVNLQSQNSSCISFSQQPAELEVFSCYAEGRSIQLLEPLESLILPQPTHGQLSLLCQSTSECTLHLYIVDALGRELQHYSVQQPSTVALHPLDLRNIGNGRFYLLIDNGITKQIRAFVNIDD